MPRIEPGQLGEKRKQYHCATSDFTEYFKFMLRDNPEFDTKLGFHNYPEDLYDFSLEARTKAAAECDAFAAKARHFLEMAKVRQRPSA